MAGDRDAEWLFVALGGAGEIGMNLYLYGYGPPGRVRWLMVDCGITFANGRIPGVDVILPDIGFIEERREALEGLVLTHAHEDHLGAIPYLWRRLRCKVWASPFAASILERKFFDDGLAEEDIPLTRLEPGRKVRVGPFEVRALSMTHSIPESSALAIRTKAGTVVHTGDWKLDPAPVLGPLSDEDALRSLGDAGVLALVGDSTGAPVSGHSGSEADLLPSLTEVIGDCEQRVAVACFATNVARLETIARAAAANDRTLVAAGHSLRRIEAAARENGYLSDVPPFVHEADAGYLPRERALILCTGSQGEPRAAMARIAASEHPHVDLEHGDTVVFSSRVIPGNEIAVGRIENALIRRGIRVITSRDRFVHVSGHPAADEVRRMYALVRPRLAIPIHGEAWHLNEHAVLAREAGAEPIVVENGSMVRLAPDPPGIVDVVPVGRLAWEGNRAVPMSGETVRGRTRAAFNGAAVVTVVADRAGRLLAEPQLSAIGLVDAGEEEAMSRTVLDAVVKAVDGMREGAGRDDEVLRETVRVAARRTFREVINKKPVTQVHLVRLELKTRR